jgi:hypothetical protein
MNRFRVYLHFFAGAILLVILAGCAGKSSTPDSHQPGDTAMPYKPPIATERASSAYADLVPDTYWCMTFGQHYEYGQVGVVKDPVGFPPGYYMYFTLSEPDWYLSDVAVLYRPVAEDWNAKSDGVPGQYPYKWTWNRTYPNPPVTFYYLSLGNFDPETRYNIAIHATIVQGSYVDGVWVSTANQTGWGGYCHQNKAGNAGEAGSWDYTWKNKWGGWMQTSAWEILPVFNDFAATYSATSGWYDSSWNFPAYWKINFSAPNPWPIWGSNPFCGWCVDPQYLYPNTLVGVQVYSCYDPDLPAFAKDPDWDLISFMLNQKHHPTAGGPFAGLTWTARDNWVALQQAVWYFKFGNADPNTSTYTALAWSFINYAIANGENYYPGSDEYYAVVLWPGLGSPLWPGGGPSDTTRFQMNIIEVDP